MHTVIFQRVQNYGIEIIGKHDEFQAMFVFYDAWLWLYNFSKLRKIGVNLGIPGCSE